MNTMQSIFWGLMILLQVQAKAQTEQGTQRELGLQFGFSLNHIKDARFSTQTKKMMVPTFGLHYRKITPKKRELLQMTFSMNRPSAPTRGLAYKIIHPEVTYTYQRKVNHHWIGGYLQHATLLHFPISTGRLFGNNPISYTIGNSLGLAFDRTFSLGSNADRQLDVALGAKAALLGHIIRPAYGHPYPEYYLQEGVFHPNRSGMGKSLLKSGRLKTVHQYQSIQLVLGLHYYHRHHLKIGLQFSSHLENYRDAKPLSLLQQQVLFSLSYVH
ncbi:MAG: hypothetical protein AAF985_01840 [Bacteroidota bacterium]